MKEKKDKPLSKALMRLCDKLKNGSESERGQSYEPNPYIDFERYALFLRNKGFRFQTMKDYLGWLHKFQTEVNDDSLKSWESHIFIKKDSQEAKLRLNYLVFLSMRLYLQAINRGDLLNILPDIREVKEIKSQPHYKGVKEDDWRIMMERIDDPLIKDATIVLRDAGLRVGEVENMRVGWLKEYKEYHILEIPGSVSKSRRDETAPISNKSYSILKPYLAGKKDTDYVFWVKYTTKRGKEKFRKLCNNDFVLCYRKLLEVKDGEKIIAKIEISPHTLRHQYAHDLQAQGFLASQIRDLLRHADISTTNIYLQENKEQVYDKFFMAHK